MQDVERSAYIAQKKPIAKALLEKLLEKYAYASILVTDNDAKSYRVGKSGISVSQNNSFGGKGMVIKVYDGKGYAEYSTNEITFEAIPVIAEQIDKRLLPLAEALPDGLTEAEYKKLNDTPCTLCRSTQYELHPRTLGDKEIIGTISRLRELALAQDERILDALTGFEYQEYHKLFLSPHREMEQSVLWATGLLALVAARGEEIRESFRGFSNLGGAEVLPGMEKAIPDMAKTVIGLLDAQPIEPGTYECICTPEVTGMIVHEAFGHGVEMDMFVKDRALARSYMGKQVASPLITMHDGCGQNEVATYFFDDEGTLSHDTVIIDKGILKAGISDAQSAMHLGTEPTGNGRRESYERKAYTRMTNTYFLPGTDKVEEMIASVKYGMLLEEPSSGMEDPKNWGIQCMVNIAREIMDGKLTGRVFSPVVLTGYVPDLLCSISMVSDGLELGGCGACGKGYKEWVKVSDGGPYIKAKIRLG